MVKRKSSKNLCYNLLMGSGRGRQRRVLSSQLGAQVQAATSVVSVVVDADVFADFIHGQGVDGVSISKYYGLPRDRSWDEAAVRKWRTMLATELFRDLVSIGAIQLPSHLGEEDFRFWIGWQRVYRGLDMGSSDEVEALCVSYKGKSETVTAEPALTFNNKTPMSETVWDARAICETVARLYESTNH